MLLLVHESICAEIYLPTDSGNIILNQLWTVIDTVAGGVTYYADTDTSCYPIIAVWCFLPVCAGAGHWYAAGSRHGILSGYSIFVGCFEYAVDVRNTDFLPREHHTGKVCVAV